MDYVWFLLCDWYVIFDMVNVVGLLGNGWLYDMFLMWDVMFFGVYVKGGEGLMIYWGWFDSFFGFVLIMVMDYGICGIVFGVEIGCDDV